MSHFKWLWVLLTLGVAGCGGHKLAECHGPVFAMNPGEWQPTAEQMK